jgi:hypothetical protein
LQMFLDISHTVWSEYICMFSLHQVYEMNTKGKSYLSFCLIGCHWNWVWGVQIKNSWSDLYCCLNWYYSTWSWNQTLSVFWKATDLKNCLYMILNKNLICMIIWNSFQCDMCVCVYVHVYVYMKAKYC